VPQKKIEERAKWLYRTVVRSKERKDAGISVNPKETQQAYEIRAALEETGVAPRREC